MMPAHRADGASCTAVDRMTAVAAPAGDAPVPALPVQACQHHLEELERRRACGERRSDRGDQSQQPPPPLSPPPLRLGLP
jgi:hypothetical protein